MYNTISNQVGVLEEGKAFNFLMIIKDMVKSDIYREIGMQILKQIDADVLDLSNQTLYYYTLSRYYFFKYREKGSFSELEQVDTYIDSILNARKTKSPPIYSLEEFEVQLDRIIKPKNKQS